MGVRLFVGTRKGLFTYDSEDRLEWSLAGHDYGGWVVNSIDHDPATGATYAAVNSVVHGPLVSRSSDGGATWSHSGNGLTYGEGGPELTAVWSVKAGIAPGVVYAGADPAGLFRSEDGGETWSEVPALRGHPTAEHWYPGAAGLILHTIVPHPADAATMWCGISAAGVYKTEDGGETWRPQNAGVPAPWDAPEPPVAGQCCHKFRLAAGSTTRAGASSSSL